MKLKKVIMMHEHAYHEGNSLKSKMAASHLHI